MFSDETGKRLAAAIEKHADAINDLRETIVNMPTGFGGGSGGGSGGGGIGKLGASMLGIDAAKKLPGIAGKAVKAGISEVGLAGTAAGSVVAAAVGPAAIASGVNIGKSLVDFFQGVANQFTAEIQKEITGTVNAKEEVRKLAEEAYASGRPLSDETLEAYYRSLRAQNQRRQLGDEQSSRVLGGMIDTYWETGKAMVGLDEDFNDREALKRYREQHRRVHNNWKTEGD